MRPLATSFLSPFTTRLPSFSPVFGLALIALTLCAGATTTQAKPVTVHQFAHADILTMSTDVRANAKWRALVGDDGAPFLVIERHDRPTRNRLPSVQRRIDGFAFGQGRLSFSGQAIAIEGLSWRGRALDFEVVTPTERLSCAVPIRGRRAFRARCQPSRRDDDLGGGPVEPVHWAGSPAVIRACGQAFFSSRSQNACLDATLGFQFDPAPIIARCDAHFFSDASTLSCLSTAAKAPADPGARLAACDAAMFSDAHTLTCFDHAVTARYEPSRAIAACDKALFSDSSAMACVEAASRAYDDVAATILACDDATYGDTAAIGCIRRGVSF